MIQIWGLVCLALLPEPAYAAEPQQEKLVLSDDEKAWVAEHREIRAGFDRHFPPYSFENEAGELEGYAVDIFDVLAERTGLKFTYSEERHWDDLYASAEARDVDLIATLVEREERKNTFEFTRSYIQKSLVVVTRKDDVRIVARQNIAGKTVAVVEGYQYVERITSEFPTVQLLERRTMLDALNAVAVGTADAAITFLGAAHHIRSQYLMTNLRFAAVYDSTDSAESIGVRKDWPVLRDVLQKGLDSISEAEKRSLRAKWLPDDSALIETGTLALTEQEKTWLRQHPVIRVGIDPEFHPFEFRDEEGRHRGYSADYLRILSKRLSVNFEVVPDLSWKEVAEKSKTGDIDVLACVGMTEERKAYLDYSPPYVDFQRVIITKTGVPFLTGLEDLRAMKVGVQANSSHEGFLKDNSDIKPLKFSTLQDSLLAVSEGKIDAFVGNVASSAYWIRRLNLDGLKVAGPASHKIHTLHFAVRKDYAVLSGILRKGLAAITPEERDEIAERWIVLKYEPKVDYSLIWKIGAGALLLGVGILLWNLQIRRQKRAAQAAQERAEQAHEELVVTHRELSRLKENLEELVASRTSQLVETERKFHQAQKMEALGTLVGGIAHDFNNVLTGILGAVYLAQSECDDQAEGVKESLGIANELGFRGAKMIEQMLMFAREGGVTKSEVRLNEFVEMAEPILRTSLPETISFRLDAEPDALAFAGNAALIEQVLLNMVNNARDALQGREEPRIVVRVGRAEHPPVELGEHEFLVFEVEDNGSGIPEDKLARIFDPFFTTKSVGEGTGLGLAMADGAIRDHGGLITVDTHPGEGTKFSVYLPLISPQPRGEVQEAHAVIRGRGETILLADDDPVVRRIHEEVLTKLGYTVVAAADGRDALELFRERGEAINLALLDVVMPNMDGITAARRLRAEKPEIRVIFLSAHDSGRGLHELLERDHEKLVRKPVSIEELSRTIRRTLDAA